MLRGDLGMEHCLLIHKNCTQLALSDESFDFLPTLLSAGLVKFVLAVFHHGFQKLSLSNHTLVETNSYQKLTILNSPTNLAEEDSATK